jgi:hypothetical protein
MDAGVVDRHAPALVAFGDVALAPAVTVGVDGQAKGVIAVVDRAADMVVYPAGIAAHIKLEDFEAVAGSQGRSLVLAAGTAVRLAAGPRSGRHRRTLSQFSQMPQTSVSVGITVRPVRAHRVGPHRGA